MHLTNYTLLILLFVLIIFNLISPTDKSDVNTSPIHKVVGDDSKQSNEPIVSKSMLIYELIEKYSEKHNVPRYIAYNIAFMETTYKGPFDWDYNPERISSAGAQGPMQVMPSTAKMIQGEYIDTEELRTNLELNIETSMMLLERLYTKYGSWKIVCGCYNTGKPIVNDYAIYCSSKKDYISKWDFYE